MTGGSTAKEYPAQYFSASTIAAVLNYPLWRASAVGQSGFRVVLQSANYPPVLTHVASAVPQSLAPYFHAFSPPYKGLAATVMGMSWARAAIFYGSDRGKEILLSMGFANTTATVLPPLVVSTAVHHGISGLWHGTSAGILKTVPKYCTAIFVKDYFERVLPPVDPESEHKDREKLVHSAIKSSAAGVAGAALTNPLDVMQSVHFIMSLAGTSL
ncbi:predicted protein [Thalassiosira pseudonana CCMP1335]|uniref:Mitochondrial carrier protein n=1 Tax=Thalassiosira pseudonana TaxID=35128 RepID=B8BUX7_THAPS|nr:predicted protein [Thalassiosira pseudonana CCMP1335]EED95363.1 predicted protein [Thalassiosira pseudonana CCMP1335]